MIKEDLLCGERPANFEGAPSTARVPCSATDVIGVSFFKHRLLGLSWSLCVFGVYLDGHQLFGVNTERLRSAAGRPLPELPRASTFPVVHGSLEALE